MSGVVLYAVTGSHGSAVAPPGTELVSFRDLAAVVGEDRIGADGGLVDYRRVVESVFRRQGVLPAPPGTVFRDGGLVMQWLELHYFTLLDALSFVEERAVARVTVERTPAHEVGGSIDEAAETVLQDALRVLRRHAIATLILGGGGQPVAASFLLDRDRWEDFAEMVERESERLPDFDLSLSGPWPPYDFVRMRFTS